MKSDPEKPGMTKFEGETILTKRPNKMRQMDLGIKLWQMINFKFFCSVYVVVHIPVTILYRIESAPHDLTHRSDLTWRTYETYTVSQ